MEGRPLSKVQTFQALYKFAASEDDELDLEPGDLIDVAIIHEGEWGVGESRRTQKKGTFPWSYVEKLQVQKLHQLEMTMIHQPMVCWHCNDFIWGHQYGRKAYKCSCCSFRCHVRCKFFVENNSVYECTGKGNAANEPEDKPIERWTSEDVGLFLVATNLDDYLPQFLSSGIDGEKLVSLNNKKLQSIGVEDTRHRRMITACIEELVSGCSITSDTNFPLRCELTAEDMKDPIQVMDLLPINHGHTKIRAKKHEFVVKSYANMQFCDHCRQLLFGLYHQGLQCAVCGFNVHRMCLDQIVPCCEEYRFRPVDPPPGIQTGLLFGTPLPALLNAAQSVPAFVDACLATLNQPKSLSTTGLHLSSAPAEKVRRLQAALLSSNMIQLPSKDVILVATLLKRFFLELPDPVIPSSIYNRVVGATILPSEVEKVNELDLVLSQHLQSPNKELLDVLIQHFVNVLQNSKSNKVDAEQLARSWSLALLRPESAETARKAADLDARAYAIRLIITKCQFGGIVSESKTGSVRKKSKKSKLAAPEAFAQSAYENLVLPQKSSKTPTMQPKLPPKPKPENRVYVTVPLQRQQSNTSLLGQPWFAGNMDRRRAEAVLADAVDGAFLVRASQSRTGYSLTVKYKEIRHIVIVEKDGKFGFSEPATFDSVEALISYFEKHSLDCYNAELTTALAFPFKQAPKASASYDDEEEEGMDEDIYISNVSSLKKSLARQARDFRYTKAPDVREAHLEKKIKELQRQVKAQQQILIMLRETLRLNEQHRTGVNDSDIHAMNTHYSALKAKIATAEGKEREIALELERTSEEQNNRFALEDESAAPAQSTRPLPPEPRKKSTSQTTTSQPRSASRSTLHPSVDSSPYYMGLMSRTTAESQLATCKEGTFLIRKSNRDVDPYTLSLVHQGVVKHIVIKYDGVRCGLAEPLAFLSLDSLVNYYHSEPLSATINIPLSIPYKQTNC